MAPNTYFTLVNFILLLGPEFISSFPNQVYNFGSGFSPCATIITTNYCLLQVADTGKHEDISGSGWILAGTKIEDGCFLTVQDCSGSYHTSNTSLPSHPAYCNTANSVCCECKGCGKDYSQYENLNSCAILFEHEGCSVCNGFRLIVNPGDEIERMDGFVENKISSVSVAPGCEMRFYLEESFSGFEFLAIGSFNLPNELNDDISSYKCTCSNDGRTESIIEGTTLRVIEITTTRSVEITTGRNTEGSTGWTSRTTEEPVTFRTLAPNPIM